MIESDNQGKKITEGSVSMDQQIRRFDMIFQNSCGIGQELRLVHGLALLTFHTWGAVKSRRLCAEDGANIVEQMIEFFHILAVM